MGVNPRINTIGPVPPPPNVEVNCHVTSWWDQRYRSDIAPMLAVRLPVSWAKRDVEPRESGRDGREFAARGCERNFIGNKEKMHSGPLYSGSTVP